MRKAQEGTQGDTGNHSEIDMGETTTSNGNTDRGTDMDTTPRTDTMKPGEAAADNTSVVRGEFGSFNKETGVLRIEVSERHLALAGIALSFVETFERRSSEGEDRAYTEMGKNIRTYVETMIREVREVDEETGADAIFKSYVPCVGDGTLPARSIEEMEEKLSRAKGRKKKIQDELLSTEISEKDVRALREEGQRLTEEIEMLRRAINCCVLLKKIGEQQPYTPIIV